MGLNRTKQFTQSWNKAALVSAVFFVLGVAWSFASPHGSSADDDFHLTTIWCAQGYSEYCQYSGDNVGVIVPRTIAYPACYVKWPATESAKCTSELTYEPIYTQRGNTTSGGYPGGFHRSMSIFAGKDVVASVQAMRIANVALASLLLFAALLLVKPPVQRAIALSWGVGVIPVGIFFIASTNASSWLITSAGLYWGLLYSVMTDHRQYDPRFWARLALLVLCVLIALLARRDAGIVLALTTVAIGILTVAPKKRPPKWLLFLFAGVTAVALLVFWRAFSVLFTGRSIPGAQTVTDQPNPVVKMALEIPGFFAALLGGQQPHFAISDSGYRQGIDGYRPTGFSYGLGWTDFSLPSAVGVLGLVAVVMAVTCGFNQYSKRRVVALLVIGLTMIFQILIIRVVDGFGGQWLVQPRFMMPFFLVALGISLLSFGAGKRLFNRLQATLIAASVLIAGSLAWLGTAGRYAVGPDAAFTNFGQTPDWWWELGPSRLVWFLIVVVATTLWVWATVWNYGAQPQRKRFQLRVSGASHD